MFGWHPAFTHLPDRKGWLPTMGFHFRRPVLDHPENVACRRIDSTLAYQIAGLSHCHIIDHLRLTALDTQGSYGFRLLIPGVRWQRRRNRDWFGYVRRPNAN